MRCLINPMALFTQWTCLLIGVGCAFEGWAAPSPPQSIAEFPEKPVLVQLPDDELAAFFVRSAENRQNVVMRSSSDMGKTWSDEAPVLELSPEIGGWNLPEALVDRDGEVHLFFLNDAHTGIISTGEAQRPKAGQLRNKTLNIWHTRSTDKRTRWQEPKQIWEGYTGALNSVVQTRQGRILLPFSCLTDRTWSNRGEGLDAFTFRGQFDSTLVYSDDNGQTWQQPTERLKVPTPDIVSAYGAVEPVVIELLDGRLWMLIRTQLGRFYETFSANGEHWGEPRPSAITSSDSPAGIVRLSDERLVLFWNNCLRYPYAYGGRQVLHAAISSNDGRTWQGFREVARDPLRNEAPPPRGDHGTAYPFPIALHDGRALFVTGQGEGRVACKVIDPAWLTDTHQEEHFTDGLECWSVFGTKGVELLPHPEKAGVRVLTIRKLEKEWPACAVWNFPAGGTGSVRLRIQAQPGFGGLSVGITDHFSTPFDLEDVIYNLFGTTLEPDMLPVGQWCEVALQWDCTNETCRMFIDQTERAALRQTRVSHTPCYLRLRAIESDTQSGGCLIESVVADVTPAAP